MIIKIPCMLNKDILYTQRRQKSIKWGNTLHSKLTLSPFLQDKETVDNGGGRKTSTRLFLKHKEWRAGMEIRHTV